MLRLFARTLRVPPSYFSNPSSIPPQYGKSEPQSQSEPRPKHEYEEPLRLRDLTSVLGMFTLAYLAVDNYTSRIKLEKLNAETTAINLKTIQLQQQNFLNTRKQQELKMMKERDDVSKRCFKMALHIALLRQQLVDLGVEPATIDMVTQEFEKNVRISNSQQNLTGHTMWIDDASPLKKQLPNYREYDKN